jgi:hypothetical protein
VSFFRVLNNLFRFNRTNWKAVSLCFLAATVFWFFNALNKNYAANVRLPLQFEFDHQKFIATRPLPHNVYVNVSGNGWDLLRKTLGLKMPAVLIALERPVEVKKIVGSTLPPLLASQLGTLTINHVVTDTLYVSIEPKDSTRMKVLVDPREITFKKGYGRTSPIVVLPDTIQLEGPVSVIRQMTDLMVITLPSKRLSSNYREQVEVIVKRDETIKRNPPVVEVMFEVGEVTEVPEVIELELLNVAPYTHIMQDKDSVECVLQVPNNRMDDFRQSVSGIKAAIDLKEARQGGRKVLPLVKGLPSYVMVVRIDSVRMKLY